ncbi:MAG: hypothetical protein GC145_03765 [Caulobacter sp.]|nr:hypothetical protein [Caulobacter sp.]
MSCDAIAAAALLWMAPMGAAAPAVAPQTVQLIHVDAAVSPLASEPLFADIVARAGALGQKAQGWKGKDIPPAEFANFSTEIYALADLDMKGHVLLKERGTDGDLKCILKGISQDLPVKLDAVNTAANGPARDAALTDLFYLLRDNVEVITTPAVVTSGT